MGDVTNLQRMSLQSGDNGYELDADERSRLEAMDIRDPDELLTPPRSSSLTFAVGIAVICHVAIVAVTSLALFADWRQYGVKLPADIRAEKKQELEDAKQQERDAKIEAERAEAAAEQGNETGDSNPDAGNDSPPAAVDASPPPEGEHEKPTDSFDLDDIDLGL